MNDNKAKRYSMMQAVFMACLVACVAALGFFATQMDKAKKEFTAQRQVNNGIFTQLRAEIDSYDTADPSGSLTADDVRDVMVSATDVGTKVADYQTQFVNCFLSGDQSTALQNNIIALMPYFDDEAKLDEGCVTGYMPWFYPSSQVQAATDLRWKFMTTYQFSGGVLDVLWEYRDGQDNLVAFAYGTYNASTGKFHGIRVTPTALGIDRYNPIDHSAGPDVTTADGYVDWTMYDPNDPSTLPEGYGVNEDGNIVDPSGRVITGAGFDDTDPSQLWDGTLPDDGAFAQEVQDIWDQRQAALENGPSQSDLDAAQHGGYPTAGGGTGDGG